MKPISTNHANMAFRCVSNIENSGPVDVIMVSAQNLILAHGSFHGPWCWDALGEYFDGYRTVLRPDFSQGGYSEHVQALATALGSVDAASTVLVVHSYAGMIASDAIAMAGVHPSRILFLDAFLPLAGESAFDYLNGQAISLPQTAAGMLVPPDAAMLIGTEDVAAVGWLAARLRPFPAATHAARSQTDATALGRATYIRCSKFPLFEAAEQRARMAGWPVRYMATGHDAMLAKPAELARLIDEAEG